MDKSKIIISCAIALRETRLSKCLSPFKKWGDLEVLIDGCFSNLVLRCCPAHYAGRFGLWSTVYQHFRDWRDEGTFDQVPERMHIRLNQEGLIDLDTWMIGHSTCI